MRVFTISTGGNSLILKQVMIIPGIMLAIGWWGEVLPVCLLVAAYTGVFSGLLQADIYGEQQVCIFKPHTSIFSHSA